MSLYTPGWYGIYSALFSVFFELGNQTGTPIGYDYVIGFAAFSLAVGLVFFILQGIGLYKMAKKRDVNHRWMAFVPFLNLLYIGMLTGEVMFFGHRFKRAGLVAMILEIVTTIFYIAVALAQLILFVYFYDRLLITTTETGYRVVQWTSLPNDAVAIKNFYMLSDYIMPVLSLVHGLFILLLYTGLFRKYDPRHCTMFAIMSVIIPFFAEIATFVLRNKNAIDYEAYVRARREEQQRRRQQYYNQNPYGPYGQNPYGQNGNYYGPYGQNPYGRSGPYGQGQNPYGQNPYGQSSPYGQNPYEQTGQNAGRQQQEPEDPFAEFGDAGKTPNDGKGASQSGGASTNSDDLFD